MIAETECRVWILLTSRVIDVSSADQARWCNAVGATEIQRGWGQHGSESLRRWLAWSGQRKAAAMANVSTDCHRNTNSISPNTAAKIAVAVAEAVVYKVLRVWEHRLSY
jgi:hypothetical protein